MFILRHKYLVGGGKPDLQHIAHVITLNMVSVSFHVLLVTKGFYSVSNCPQVIAYIYFLGNELILIVFFSL
jgi:hypothetical protein